MSCTITKGLNRGACRAMGGIKEVYFIKGDDTYYAPSVVSNEISQLTGTDGNELILYKFENLIGSGRAIETNTYDEAAGTQFFNQEVSIFARGFDAERILMFKELCKSTVAIVVHYNSGISRLFGKDFFMDASGGENTSGEAAGDANSFNVVFGGKEVEAALPIVGSTLLLPLGTMPLDGYTVINGD